MANSGQSNYRQEGFHKTRKANWQVRKLISLPNCPDLVGRLIKLMQSAVMSNPSDISTLGKRSM